MRKSFLLLASAVALALPTLAVADTGSTTVGIGSLLSGDLTQTP